MEQIYERTNRNKGETTLHTTEIQFSQKLQKFKELNSQRLLKTSFSDKTVYANTKSWLDWEKAAREPALSAAFIYFLTLIDGFSQL